MNTSYRHIVLGIAVVALVGGAIVGLQDKSSDGDQRSTPTPDEPVPRAHVRQSPLEARQRPGPPVGSDEGRDVHPESRETSASEWSDRFHRSTDYWAFVSDAADDAAAGDARAQFLIAEALGECHTSVALNRRLYPDPTMTPEQMFDVSFWKNASPSTPSHYVEFSRRSFMKCAKFFEGDPPALSDLQIGSEALSREYWLTLALENDDPVAKMQEAYMLVSDLDAIEEGSRPAAIARIREGLAVAAASADPSGVPDRSASRVRRSFRPSGGASVDSCCL